MSSIGELGKEYGFHIIEDASHAIGSTYHGEPVGNCRYSDITVFSFHAVKAITTGEGGMALTNSKEMYERMSQLRTHGITRDPGRMTRKPDGPWYYEQTELGFNYRMNDIQAALGISQLNKLEEFVDQRRKLARHYDKTLAGFPVRRQVIPKWVESARHLYIVRVNSDRHHELFNGLQAKGFGVNLHYMPVHLQPYYRKLGFRENCFLEAEAYGREAISLPLYPTLSDKDQNRVIETLTALI
jgi:dTDP-4-amino-4,6-dideoxygalactose transaminase